MAEAFRKPQLIGWIPPGINQFNFHAHSANARYFAYASGSAVYVVEMPSLAYAFIHFFTENSVFSISLNPSIQTQLAISNKDCSITVFDIKSRMQIASYNASSPASSIAWGARGKVIIASVSGSLVYAEVGEDSLRPLGLLPNFQKLVEIELDDQELKDKTIILGGGEEGGFTRIGFTTCATDTISLHSPIFSVDLDGASHCLVVAEDFWVFYDISANACEVQRLENSQFKFGAGSWLSDPPGHFITGDLNTGTILLWNLTSQTPINSFHVHCAGFKSMERVTSSTILCVFADGYIGLLDYHRRKFIWTNKSNHSNTIFALCSHPINHDVVISCGASKNVCFWNTNTLEQVDRIVAEDTWLVSMAASAKYVAFGYKNGKIGVFSIETLQFVREIKVSETIVTSVSFSKYHPSSLLVCSQREFPCIVNVETASIDWRGQAPSRGGCFSPHEEGVYALGFEDGSIIVYKNSSKIVLRFPHGPIYSLAWSPHDPNLIMTASDSGSIVAWNVRSTDAFVLGNHKKKARPVCFNPSIPGIAMSGSYDGTITIYNINRRTLETTVLAHHSHVYAATFCEENPFLLITAGRDATIKLWSIDSLFVSDRLENLIKTKSSILRPLPFRKQLQKLIRRMAFPHEKPIFTFEDVVHARDATQFYKKLAEKMDRDKPIKIRKAEIELRNGNMKEYCETLIKCGYIKKALAFAPSVSAEYWKELLKKIEPEKANILVGNTNGLIEKKDFQSAFLVAVAAENGRFGQKSVASTIEKPAEKKMQFIETSFSTNKALEFYYIASQKKGDVYHVASSFLSVGDAISAELYLLRNGEGFAAATIDLSLNIGVKKVQNYLEWLLYTNQKANVEIAEDVKKLVEEASTLISSDAYNWIDLKNISDKIERAAIYSKNVGKDGLTIILITSIYKAAWKGYHNAVNFLIKKAEELGTDQKEMKQMRFLSSICESDSSHATINPAGALLPILSETAEGDYSFGETITVEGAQMTKAEFFELCDVTWLFLPNAP